VAGVNDLGRQIKRLKSNTACGVPMASTDGRWTRPHPAWGVTGAFLGYIGCAVDIDERYVAEQFHRENEGRLRLAKDASAIGMWDWDLKTGQVRWSPEC
jgi:PAS domain-containing protein